VRWTLEVSGAAEAAAQLAERVSGGDGRGAGLLANRHCQDIKVEVA
jgi:hypothetical protein